MSNGKCTAGHVVRSTWTIVRSEISWLRTATVMLIAITAALIGHHYGPEAHGALYGLQVLAWPASLASIWLAAERAGSTPPGTMQDACPGLGALTHWAGAVIYPALVIAVAWIANRIAPPGSAEAPEWITTSDLAWMTAASLAAFSLRTTHRVRASTPPGGATQVGGGRLATMTGALVLMIGTWIGATAQSETAAEALGTLERLRSLYDATWGIGPIEITMHAWWTGAGVAMAGLLATGIAWTAGGASPTRAWILILLCIGAIGAGNPHPLSAVMIYAIIAPLIMLAPICAGPAPIGREGALATWVGLAAIVLCAALALNAVLSNGTIEEIFGAAVVIWAMTAHTACQCRDLLMHRVLVTRWPGERLTGLIWIIWVVCAWGIGTSILWSLGAPAWVAGAIAPPIDAVIGSLYSNETIALEATVREAAIGALASAATLAGLWAWMARRKPR